MFPVAAQAAVEITEVMYDVEGADAGREWIQITNLGTSTVDVSEFRLLEAGVHHKLKAVQGGVMLASGVSAVIADNAENFLAEKPDYAGILFDSSFSLSNSGETLVLKNAAGGIEHTHSYTAPVVEKPVSKKATLSTSKKSPSSATSTSPSAARVKFGEEDQQPGLGASVGSASLGLLGWVAALVCLVSVGIAGVIFLRQEKKRSDETTAEGHGFTIIEK